MPWPHRRALDTELDLETSRAERFPSHGDRLVSTGADRALEIAQGISEGRPITKVSRLFVAEPKPCRQGPRPTTISHGAKIADVSSRPRVIATLALRTGAHCCALWYWQGSFIFQPSPVVQTTPSDLGVKFEKVTLPIGSGQVAVWWVPSQDLHSATLLYSHGNANNVGGNLLVGTAG
jgi:hypothetical protein